MGLYIFKIFFFIKFLFLKYFLLIDLMYHLILYLKFNVYLGLERLVNYAGEFK